MGTPGNPGIETPPISKLPGTTMCTSYQMLGNVSSRCGSPASIACPLAERDGATAQLLLANARACSTVGSVSFSHDNGDMPADVAPGVERSDATMRAAMLSGAPGVGIADSATRAALRLTG